MPKLQQLSFVDFEEVASLFPAIPKKGKKIILPKKKILTATEIFAPFFLETYIPMKHNKDRVELIKGEMKERLKEDERKRIEFNRFNLVAKWRVMSKYETDYAGLNELLFDHGLLKLISLPNKGLNEEAKAMVEPFKLPSDFYVVPTVTTKKAKGKIAEFYEDFEVENIETDNLLALFSRFHTVSKEYEAKYDDVKKQMLNCQLLQKDKKATFEFGSIGLRENSPGYDIDALIDFLGIDFLLAYGKPDMQALDFFMDKGMVDRKEVESFRKEVDRRVDFLLMTKESEQKQFEIYQKKLERKIRLSINR